MLYHVYVLRVNTETQVQSVALVKSEADHWNAVNGLRSFHLGLTVHATTNRKLFDGGKCHLFVYFKTFS